MSWRSERLRQCAPRLPAAARGGLVGLLSAPRVGWVGESPAEARLDVVGAALESAAWRALGGPPIFLEGRDFSKEARRTRQGAPEWRARARRVARRGLACPQRQYRFAFPS